MSAVAVIGAAFGDEGKGLMTDYFCRQFNKTPIVVRYNGGAQAGHTVTTDVGRHVFSHIGSGHYTGADTYLSEHFLVNPVAFRKEYTALMGVHKGRIYVHPRALVTTIYDMYINQELEKSRGDNRHGSCGMGINETMLRSRDVYRLIQAASLRSHHSLTDLLIQIQNGAIKRLIELELLNDEREAWIRNVDTMRQFMDDCRFFFDNVHYSVGYILQGRDVVFEGAQGLLLDANSQFFPHVTHSRTGLHNILDIASSIGIDQIDVSYVMRTYLTRHGAGPLPGESATLNYEDRTNVSNDWQGSLRFARQNNELMQRAILKDLASAKERPHIKINPNVALTHRDQEAFVPRIEGVPMLYWSDGPYADDVSCV